jgi:hypothetical protein
VLFTSASAGEVGRVAARRAQLIAPNGDRGFAQKNAAA